MAISRHQMREIAFILTFEKLFADDCSADEILALSKEVDELVLSQDTEQLFCGVCAHQALLDEEIKKYLQGWTIARISRVSLAILRLAAYEILYCNTPVGVAIDEAVELAKCYSTKEDAQFVNGVLGKLVRERALS